MIVKNIILFLIILESVSYGGLGGLGVSDSNMAQQCGTVHG